MMPCLNIFLKYGRLYQNMNANTFPRFRRRNYFIKKGLQMRFVLGLSSAVLLGFFLNLILVYFMIDRELAKHLYGVHLKIRSTSEVAVPVMIKIGIVSIPSIILISAIIGYYLTRRVELPLESFKAAISKASHGNLSPGALTQRDLDQNSSKHMTAGLAEAFNDSIGSLEVVFRSLKKSVEKLDKASDKLKSVLKNGGVRKEELAGVLNDVRGARMTIHQEVSRFKV